MDPMEIDVAEPVPVRRTLAQVIADQAGKGLPTDDVLHLLLPLMRAVAELHAQGRVASLAPGDVAEAADGSLALVRPHGLDPAIDLAAIRRVQPQATSALKVVGEYRVTTDEAEGSSVLDLDTADEGDTAVTRPVYIAGLRSWEIELGHHDEITDVFGLGMIMAALACGFDPSERDELARFSLHRTNLFALQPRLHPVLAVLIGEATALNRHDRTTDVGELARRLEQYREQPAGLEVERALDGVSGLPGRRQAVLTHLRDRLFDLSRRNRLLHFRPTQGSVNLTEASVPIVVRLESIRAEQLCTWDHGFAGDVLGGKPVPLNRWLRFEDQLHLPASFDKLIGDARRDRAEYGFSPLRLVVAFLRWHNLKEAPEERIVSPLLWLPVEVTRAKGVRDRYVLTCPEPIAEFNPALRHQLRQLYDIQLPETVDLSTTDIATVHADLLAQIQASEPGVALGLQRRPAIQLILQRAVQRVRQFNRRRGGGKQAVSTATDFSYARDDYRPLGHALFEKFVRPSPLPQRLATGGHLKPRPDYMVAQTEGQSFALGVDEGHRFAWEVDLTQVTLANFNYKKMSLVRDYAELIDGRVEQPAFDRVFSIEPRPLERDAPPAVARADRWGVVAADATQDAAVALARTGESFIIQGPPGTGKSQTITNLIADFAARGKRVLFVCEKRAALDVVFHRLGQAGLDGLSCIIHDSQEDKKGFILDLKDRYELWSKTGDGAAEAETARDRTVAHLVDLDASLDALDEAAGGTVPGASASLRALVRRAAALPAPPSGYGPAARERLPTLALWDAHRPTADRLARMAREVLGTESLAAHCFARLTRDAIAGDRPVSTIEATIDAAEAQLASLDRWLDGGSLFADGDTPLGIAAATTRHAAAMRRTGLASTPALLEADSAASAELARDRAGLEALAAQAVDADARAAPWHDPLAPADVEAALSVARAQQTSFFRFLSGDWRRLKATVQARYDFAAHAVAPGITAVLEALGAAQAARAALEAEQRRLTDRYATADLAELVAARTALIEALPREPGLRRLVDAALAAPDGGKALAIEAAQADTVASLLDGLSLAIEGADALTFDEAAESLRDLREALDDLPAALPALVELHGADPAVLQLLRHAALPLPAIEALLVDEAIARVRRAHPALQRFDIDRLVALTRAAADAEATLRRETAAVIRARLHARFREHVRRSTLALSQLDCEGRRFKTIYATGRRELEHEFGKSMRYRSIRDLADDETGVVVRDLKPIWLMSPLSVSDTLPIAPDLFDVVIFDEASQVPTEDAVPALSRGPQVIIVGDEMQLPPTSFFSAAPSDEDAEVVAEEEGQRIAILLDADSLLAQSARNLPATMLAWHYRSRSEALISFSNAAFYQGRLVTIPDRVGGPAALDNAAIGSEDAQAWENGVARTLAAPITVHRIADGLYERRVNPPEARYIAGLVRAFLLRDTGLSIGIVAFSEAQQGEIEAALERLAGEDRDFAALLETEIAREDDGQFNGLFVKNLENVQGDERDVMIMSICYAPGRDGRMAMNFGPINQRGGEKRLNVIFSRARRHMAIVSTVDAQAITNVHNDGARALKSFLSFAQAQSEGAREHAQAVLGALNPSAARTFDTRPPEDAVRAAIAAALRARGHAVDEWVGGASFRCDLAIRGADGYALAVLLDHDRDRGMSPAERYVFRPTILRQFGWRMIDVPVSDWLDRRGQVIDRVEAELRRDSWIEAEAAPPEPSPVIEPLSAEPIAEEQATADALTEFRFRQGGSDKFWRVGVVGADLIVEFGRTGTKGQRVVKTFDDPDRARRESVKLTLEKTRKGYEEVG